mmetsp:Transcript_9798/g.35908  ORF Transcript_9798/g.35908 Transcript_9798/m.35908 type:complete len:234 (+) Transcript_9798:1626-2327(+)
MPARRPRPKSRCASPMRLNAGLVCTEVSSLASQSKLNLNFSLGLSTFFFCFFSPRYCRFISSSCRCRSRSAASASCSSWLRGPRSRRSSALLRPRGGSGGSEGLALAVLLPAPLLVCCARSASRFARRASTSWARRASAAAARCSFVMKTGLACAACSSCRRASIASSDTGSRFSRGGGGGNASAVGGGGGGGGRAGSRSRSSRRSRSRRSSRRSRSRSRSRPRSWSRPRSRP